MFPQINFDAPALEPRMGAVGPVALLIPSYNILNALYQQLPGCYDTASVGTQSHSGGRSQGIYDSRSSCNSKSNNSNNRNDDDDKNSNDDGNNDNNNDGNNGNDINTVNNND